MTVDLDSRLYIGPAGWQYDDWYGTVYPSPRPRGFDPLAYVASYFNLIEINSTFYRVPPPATCRRWAERVEIHPRFLFTAKAHQSFTHRGNSSAAEHAAYVKSMSPLHDAGRLGAVLLQFPWSFRFDEASRHRLDELVLGLGSLPLALEVRHASWASDDARAYLSEKPLTVCGIDQPVIGESLRPYQFLPGPAGAYFRFHGRNYRHWFAADAGRDQRYDYLYTQSELSPWADVIRSAAKASERVFVVLNNHFRGQAPANAFELSAMLLSRPTAAPPTLRRAFPHIATYTTASSADAELGDLFGQ